MAASLSGSEQNFAFMVETIYIDRNSRIQLFAFYHLCMCGSCWSLRVQRGRKWYNRMRCTECVDLQRSFNRAKGPALIHSRLSACRPQTCTCRGLNPFLIYIYIWFPSPDNELLYNINAPGWVNRTKKKTRRDARNVHRFALSGN